jgi:glycosyltransferase involved in cell wall biosynthesis
MKISIITVVFNGEKTIARAVESIYTQRGVEVEHIVIDGASSDGTLAVLRRFQKNIAVLISEPDQGIYDAMNKGIKLATGEIIGILNADDCYANQYVLNQVCNQFESQNVEAVFGDVDYFDADNQARVTRVYRSSVFHPKKLARGVMPAHPALFLRRGVYERYGLFNIGFKIAGDFDFIARIFKSGELRYVYIPSTLTRMQNGGISTQGLRSTIILNREILRSCLENQIPSSYIKLLSRYPKKVLEYIFKG